MAEYEARVRRTVISLVTVDAASEADAKEKIASGSWDSEMEVDQPDWEIEGEVRSME